MSHYQYLEKDPCTYMCNGIKKYNGTAIWTANR